MHAAGVNATDWKSRAGGGLGLWNDPPVLGHDVSGVVEAVGLGVTLYRPGDAVFGTTDFVTAARGVDIVFDAVGGEYGTRSLRVPRPGGVLVSLASPAEQRLVPHAEKLGVRAGFTLVEPDYSAMLAISELVRAGQLRPHVETVLPLARAAKAHELGESGRTTGKIVLAVAPS